MGRGPRALTKVVLLAVGLAGCTTTLPPGSGYYRIDGRPLTPGSDLEKQFWVDRAICRGEMSKADVSGVTTSTDDFLIDAAADIDRDRKLGTVMLGCMAQRGYKVVIGGQSSLTAGAVQAPPSYQPGAASVKVIVPAPQ